MSGLPSINLSEEDLTKRSFTERASFFCIRCPMTSQGLQDALEQMNQFLNMSPLCIDVCVPLWVCCISHSLAVV